MRFLSSFGNDGIGDIAGSRTLVADPKVSFFLVTVRKDRQQKDLLQKRTSSFFQSQVNRMNKQQEQSTVGRMEDDDSVSSNFYHEEEEEFLEEGATRSEKRDELDEIKKMAQRETTRVRVWKGILLVVLGVTAALVTAGTYRILEQEEEEDFETAVSGRWQF